MSTDRYPFMDTVTVYNPDYPGGHSPVSIAELIKNLIFLGCIVVGGYAIYQYLSPELITRTTDEPNQSVNEDSETDAYFDDCERYVNAETRQSCIDARSQ